MKKLLLLTDLGRIRVVEWTRGPELEGDRERFAELEDVRWNREKATLRAVAADQSGRFAQGGVSGQGGGMSYGEEHELERELRRRELEELAGRVDGIVAEAGFPACYLAAPKSMLKTLEQLLSAESMDAIRRTIPADLTREPIGKLRERFSEG